jgi:hypothetical protein
MEILRRWFLLISWGGVGGLLPALPTRLAEADEIAAAPAAAALEADWLRQHQVRSLPASPRDRSKTVAAPVTTRQDAAGACDGVKNGRYGFHTSNDPRPWWQVDLGESMPLDRVVIFNRCDGQVEDRAGRLQVLVSGDGQQWSELYRHDGNKFFGQTDGKPLVVPAAGKRGRLLRVALPAAQYLHLDEVEVYCVGSDNNVALNKPADQSSVSQWSTMSLPAAEPPPVENEAVAEGPYAIAESVRRGLRLADNLDRLGVDVKPHVAELRQIARQAQTDAAKPAHQRALYFQTRRIQRTMSLANPLLDFDDILFVKRVPGTFTHMSDQYYGWWSRPGGGLYVLRDFKSPTPRLRCLTEPFAPGSFLRPDISYDGRKVLFAYCKYHSGLRQESDKLDKRNVPEDAFYHVYEMQLDGTGLRQLTAGKYDDFDARYLPSGEIVFLSTRRGQAVQCTTQSARASREGAQPDCYVRCGGGPSRPVAVYTLHVMDPDGGNLRPISSFEMFEWTPSIDHDGRILYARWDYVDRHNMPYMSLWSTWPDGSNTQTVFGNFTRNPHCMFEARPIPGSRKLIFTASGHHANTGGSLVLLDPRAGADGDAAMTRLTPEVAFPETEGWPLSYFANPYPLSEDHYLVAWSDREMIGWPGPPEPENAFGIYLFDAFGNLTLLHRDPAISSMTPLPVRARRRPPVIPELADWEGPQSSRMLLVDVYQGLPEVPRGAIRALRLVGVPVKTHPTMNYPVLGVTRDDPGKFVLGTVPVEADGSAHFHVPSGVPLFFQALDAQGRAVQTMRTATYAQPGSTVTCVGCHEPRRTAPPDHVPLAGYREPSPIQTGPAGSWPLDFHELVQPLVDAHCVRCHRPGTEGAKWDLTADGAYDTLVNYGRPSLREHVLARYGEGRSTAGACPSQTSPLVALLERDHHEVKLPPADWQRLFTWLDTYGHRQGSFDEDQKRRLRDLKQRLATMRVVDVASH